MNKIQILNRQLTEIKRSKLDADVNARDNLINARKNPKFNKIDTQMRKIKMEISRHAQTDDKVKELYFEYNKLREKWSEILREMGMSPQDLKPHYSCKLCNDTGYVNKKICKCLQKRMNNEFIRLSGISDFEGHTFEQSDSQIVNSDPMLKRAYDLARAYVENFPNYKYKNIVLMGDVGTGKTYLMECIANELLKRNKYVIFMTSFDLNNVMMKTMTGGYAEREELMKPLLDCDLLVIDDLGSEAIVRSLSISNLYTVINERQRKNLPVIVGTNLTPSMINEHYGDRIMSRLFNKRVSVVVQLEGKDLRINA